MLNSEKIDMSTITEIQEAIAKLPPKEKSALAAWLQSQDELRMSEREEAALLASLDKAAAELDAGRGVPVDRVREMVGQWLTK
jgi:predicted transcriptional regulator